MTSILKRLMGQPANKAEARQERVRTYLAGNREPWSTGYDDYKWQQIEQALSDPELLQKFANRLIAQDWGVGLDERIVEYPWLFTKIRAAGGRMLDAGSTFNFPEIVKQPVLENQDLTIFTLMPEKHCFFNKRISYVFGDLRDLPFRNDWFDTIVCHSTIEHVGMDNSIYGESHAGKGTEPPANEDYLQVLDELVRTLKDEGQLLLTFPCGRFENHGFFQQFDTAMIGRVKSALAAHGNVEIDFFLYRKEGWKFATAEECADAESFNPHTGRGKKDDGAAHCRAVCCVEFYKGAAR